MTLYYMLHFVSFFQNFPDGIILKPYIPLHVGLKSCIPSECA
ncbi:hypothetical protein Barb6_00063 [Bacteroidales bacterium Barb6]|nr:hypothetical protein Barb6_00063 [Bacteroidales bacterium Barb6]